MLDPKRRASLTLASVYLTFFIDSLSWSIVFPIFAPYFLDIDNKIFSPDVTVALRTSILGFFLMAFSLGQFFGAPLIGEYADLHGRKKALTLSVFFTLAGLGLTAWSMEIGNLYLLFAGRLITGIFASNMAVCLSCVSDISEGEARARNFGLFSLIGGLSFILGAFLGGKLSDPTISSYFKPTFPLWIATWLTIFNFLFIILGFKETSTRNQTGKFHFFESFQNIKIALQTENIKHIYAVYFLFLFAWTILFQFTPVLVVDKFYFTSSNIGDLALYMGICWAIGSGYLIKIVSYYFLPYRILEVCLLCFTILCGLIALPAHIYGVLGILGFCVIIGGVSWPLCTTLISNSAPREIQGKILGLSQSFQSLAMAIAPLVGGIAFHVSMKLPFFLGAAACLLGLIIHFVLKNRQNSLSL